MGDGTATMVVARVTIWTSMTNRGAMIWRRRRRRSKLHSLDRKECHRLCLSVPMRSIILSSALRLQVRKTLTVSKLGWTTLAETSYNILHPVWFESDFFACSAHTYPVAWGGFNLAKLSGGQKVVVNNWSMRANAVDADGKN